MVAVIAFVDAVAWMVSINPGVDLIGKSFTFIDDGCRLETLLGQVLHTMSCSHSNPRHDCTLCPHACRHTYAAPSGV